MMGAGGVLDNGPMTPRNDVGPWVFDGSAGGVLGGSGSLVGRAVDGEHESGVRD
jgi:hypothetical protein